MPQAFSLFGVGVILGIAVFAAAFGGAKTASAAVLFKPANNLGLVLYQSFEDSTGTIATDFSGQGNSGVLTNMEAGDWITGKKGKALDFDGSDEYVSVANGAGLNPTTAYTASTWVKFDSFANQYGILLMKAITGGYHYRIYRDTTNLYFDVAAGAAGVSGLTLETGRWYHIVMVYDGSQGTDATRLKVYLDGAAQTLSFSGSPPSSITAATNPVYLASNVGASLFHDGQMDEVRIYDRALSATEVAAMYGSTSIVRVRERDRRGLVGHWSFEDATGTIATDFSGLGNSGTLTGMSNSNWVSGKFGKALNFTTSTEYVDAGNANSLKTNPATISFWVNTTDTGSGARAVQKQGTWAIIPSQGGDGANGVTISDSGCVCGRHSLVRVDDGFWHHIAFAYQSGSPNGSFIYVDGTLATTTENTLTDTGQVVKFGGTNFVGKIDDVRIYNRILSATEVANLYSAGSGVPIKVNTSRNSFLTDGLAGLWSFDGPDLRATTAYDRSGTGNNGTLTNGPIPAIGKIGQALRFDGSDDYVVSPTSAEGLTSGSISFWVKDSTAGTKGIMQWAQVANPGSGVPFIYLQNASQVLTWYVNGGYNLSGGTLTRDVWTHITVTFDGTTWTSYKDGALVTTYSGGLAQQTGSTHFYVGSGYHGYYLGLIDDVRIYNRVLTAAEVLQLYNIGK